jgi:diguanylate cyclase (GGDEF)-like protein
MDLRPDDMALGALLRMIGTLLPGTESAVYAVADDRMRLLARSPGLTTPEENEATGAWRPTGPALAGLGASGESVLAPADAFGVSAQFCAVRSFGAASGRATGLVALFDPRGRRFGPDVAAALADAAAVLEGLLAASRARAPEPPSPETPDKTVLPRTAAYRMIEAARLRRGGDWTLLLLDVGRLHAVNAALGEPAGDTLLAAIGGRLASRLGPGDCIARLEGDLFVVLSPRPPETAEAFAAGLLAAARQPLAIAGRTVVAQASVGVVAGVPPDVRARTVMAQADAALRRAKADGRNRYALHEPLLHAATAEDSRLELDLAEAAERGQMRLVYQGYVDLAQGRVGGVEALLRWRHPTRGELAPAQFIPLAEATGLILPLGAWALRAALAAAARWSQRLAVSVNVSALQFHQPDFVAEVEAALAESGVAPERLELEITETVLMRDNPETRAQLDALIAMGVRIALDDFGTGYSALAYLGRLPHHRIKLDRTFVHDLGNPATLDLVRAILSLARKTGVCVTAEGVERPDQLRLVRSLGFTHAQGFFTGPPLADPMTLLVEPQSAV